MPKLKASAARDRQAAYTLFLEAYDEVRVAIAYVRRKEGDVDESMPSLYARRNGGMKKKPVVDEPTEPASPTVPTNDNHDAPVGLAGPTPTVHATAEVIPEAQATTPVTPSGLTNGSFMH